jgi:hypothetical protein
MRLLSRDGGFEMGDAKAGEGGVVQKKGLHCFGQVRPSLNLAFGVPDDRIQDGATGEAFLSDLDSFRLTSIGNDLSIAMTQRAELESMLVSWNL